MVMGKLGYKLMAVSLAGFLGGLAEVGYFQLQKQTKEPSLVAKFYDNNQRISKLRSLLTPPLYERSSQWDLSNPENIKYFIGLQQELSTLVKESENLSRQPDVSAVIRKNEEYENYTKYGAYAIIASGLAWAVMVVSFLRNAPRPVNGDIEQKVL